MPEVTTVVSNTSELYSFIASIGVPSFIVLVSAITGLKMLSTLITSFSEIPNVIATKLDEIKGVSGKTCLTKEQSVSVFKAILFEHIHKKLEFIQERLEKNHIFEREEEVKEQISSVFERITREEATLLSTFNSISGDLGRYLFDFVDDEENWKNFLDVVYKYFFNKKATIEQKLSDIEGHMNKVTNNLLKKIEDRSR